MSHMKTLSIFGLVCILNLGLTARQAGAFTFDQDPGDDALVWVDDFDNNNNGWVLNGTEISNPARVVRASDGAGGCGTAAAGNAVGFLHLDEDDGDNGRGFAWGGTAYLDLVEPVDVSGGPASFYVAFNLPSVVSPRTAAGLAVAADWDLQGPPDENISFTDNNISIEWLQGFRMQMMVDSNGWPGCCGPPCECGAGGMCPSGTPFACPNGQVGTACNSMQFRLNITAGGSSASIDERNLVTNNTGQWRNIIPDTISGQPSNDTIEGMYDRIYLYGESDGAGGNRFEAVGLTVGYVPVEISEFVME